MKPPFNIYEFLRNRPLSYSAISSFEWNPRQWYESYILGERQTSPELTFGSYVDKRIQQDKKFLPDLPRYPLMQFKMKAMFKDIPLVGIPDGLDIESPRKLLSDYKTGKKKNPWNKKRADETGQLTFYLFLLWLTRKLKPEDFDCFIHWIPTQMNEDKTVSLVEPVEIKTFKTKRTMKQLLEFGSHIIETVKQMEKYARFEEEQQVW